MSPSTRRISSDHRKELLAQAVTRYVVEGFRVEAQGDYHAVFVEGRPVNHVLHLLLSILTVGIWILVWILLAVFGGEARQMVNVDEFGNVNVVEV